MQTFPVRPGRALSLLVTGIACLVVTGGSPGVWLEARQARGGQAAAPASLPSAPSILERHVKAVGGRDAILAHSSSYTTGTIAVPSAGLTGEFEIFAAKPNRMLLKSTLPGVGEIQEGFDGTVAWSISPLTGPIRLEGKQLEQRKFDAEFHGELLAEERYTSITNLEETLFEGRPCYKVRLVRPGGDEDIHYYDVETGLKAGGVVTRETPMGAITSTSVESDYRRFGRLLQPSKLTVSAMGLQQVMTITAVEYDAVDPDVFELPAQIKALVK